MIPNVSQKPNGAVLKLCPTLCSHMDCSPPGSSVHGIPRQEYWSGVPFPTPGDLPLLQGILSTPRAQSHVSCVSCLGGGFFTISVTC